MSILVLKFGGTSVGSVDLIKSAAQIIKKEYDLGHNIAVVVSAMSGTTNKLIENINLINSENKNAHDDAEYDAIVASGEQITSGLMALALKDLNIDARSWLGWQLPIYTSGNHRHSVISKIEDEKIINGFKNRQVAVVAGFQGVGSDGRITTIGRGGSDNTAVFLASALNAERCDIYTDVNGVYTTDPRMADNVKRLNKISYEEMIEMSSQGAKVLQTSSVESAINHNVKVQVRSTFHPDDMGTVISDEVMNNEYLIENVMKWIKNNETLSPLIYSSADPKIVKEKQIQYGQEILANKIESFFEKLSNKLLNHTFGIFISAGGETSGAVVNGLGLQEFKIGKEIAHGVPALWSPNSNCNKPISVTLKSGNFGQADFFKRALQILRGKT